MATMTTVDCPHQVGAVRTCAACKSTDDGDGMLACEGEIEAHVYPDSDGDPGVINGVRHFMAIEDETALCGCTLSEAEWDTVRDKLVEAVSDPSPYD